jgi:hypothetical protein
MVGHLKLPGPGLGLLYFLNEPGEAVRNFPQRGGLVVLSKPPTDYGADVLLFP